MKAKIDTPDIEIEKMALDMDEIKKWTLGNVPKKVIVIKNRLINIVV